MNHETWEVKPNLRAFPPITIAQWGDPNQSNLAAGWHLDEGSGTATDNYGPNNKDGTLTNGPTWVAGKVP